MPFHFCSFGIIFCDLIPLYLFSSHRHFSFYTVKLLDDLWAPFAIPAPFSASLTGAKSRSHNLSFPGKGAVWILLLRGTDVALEGTREAGATIAEAGHEAGHAEAGCAVLADVRQEAMKGVFRDLLPSRPSAPGETRRGVPQPLVFTACSLLKSSSPMVTRPALLKFL